jgi:hypothetical protein
MSDKTTHQHDEVTKDGYKKRCYCEKCKRKYDEFCKKSKHEGKVKCQRKCHTICEIKCEQPVEITKHWGYKKEYETKWDHFRPERAPRKCDKCKKDKEHCGCGGKKGKAVSSQ